MGTQVIYEPDKFPAHSVQIIESPLQGALVRTTTDRGIIEAWLGRPGLASATIRNLRKDAERFLLWIESRGGDFRQVRFEDITEYSKFVMNPEPADKWISKTKWPRQDPRWRPFSGPLSTTSHRKALDTIKSLFSWCALARYIDANPAVLLGRVSVPTEDKIERYLPLEGIGFMMDACERMKQETWRQILRAARARFLVCVYYYTGTRLHEVASADMNSFKRDDSGAWWLHVMGKGSRRGQVPVSLALLQEFKRYREAFGLSPMPSASEDLPLVLTITGCRRRAIDNVLYKDIKAVMAAASELALMAGDDFLSVRLSKASTHWLRHSSLTHQLDAGVPLKTVQLNARHANISTTSPYLHKDDANRHRETIAAIKIRR